MNEIIFSNAAMPVVSGCGLLAAAEPFYHADRTADFNVLIYVADGVINVTEDGTDYAVEKGELFFLKHGIRHFGRTEIPKGTRWYFVHFYFEDGDSEPFLPAEELPRYTPVRYSAVLPKKLSGLTGSEIEVKIHEFAEYYLSADKKRGWFINLRLAELLSEIVLCGNSCGKPLTLSDKIAAYLNSHFSEPFSAKKLEREFFLSYKHMAAVFKGEKGVTMQQYHNRLRMNEACRLLKSTLMSVGEVAAAAGFSDMLYFSRSFRAFMGASPTEYRKSAAEKDY